MERPALIIYHVDAFTDRPFAGNPAGVCLLPEARPPGWMQQVALEVNLSETAFLVRQPEGAFSLRWFTPTVEVDLCGHATLASAHVLWEGGTLAESEAARFVTKSGPLGARREGRQIMLDFPAEPVQETTVPGGLEEALGLSAPPVFAGRNRMDVLVALEREADVRALAPNLTRLAEVDARGVIVTAPADSGVDYDFVSRFFGPRAGVPEDPVTGSAHCALGPYWAARLGRDHLTGYQASARGGRVGVRLRPEGRVDLLGRAVTTLRSELLV